LTASHALHPNKAEDRKHILRLFLSLLTWDTPGDAGLPEWSNDAETFVQRSKDDRDGVRMRVKENLYERHGIRGRGPHISRLCPVEDKSDPSSEPSSVPAPAATTLRRLAEKALKVSEPFPPRRGSGGACGKSP
jgi:hypothetical protein